MGASTELAGLIERSLEALNANPAARAALDRAPQAVRDSVRKVFGASDFVAQACARDAQLVDSLITSADLERSLSAADFACRAPQAPAQLPPDAQVQAALRRWRRHELTRIAWRDLAGGEVQPLLVIGMGKLGGGELNFSSDVDLVLLFPEHGETDGARGIANEEFFTRLGQGLVRLLETPTPDGFVLRVDLRLRPFGDSGPLVSSFASFEDYLPRHGRDWERYAYVKARPVTAAERYAELEAAAVRPFVYRRYLDYGVFESLREMKTLIEHEIERRELADHIKLGPGGIREIEFIVQALQLTRGGRDRRLQTPSLFA